MDYLEFKTLRHADDELYHRSHKYLRRYRNSKGKYVYVYATTAESLDLLAKGIKSGATNGPLRPLIKPNPKEAFKAASDYDHALERSSVKAHIRRAIGKAKQWLKGLFSKKTKKSLISNMKTAAGVKTVSLGRAFIERRG